MAVWSVLAQPLFVSADFRNMSQASAATLLNAQALAIDQDPLGQMGARLEASRDAPLQRWPLGQGPRASRPHSPVWLALPADWQEHPVLRHTAQELGRIGAAQQLEG